MLVSITSCTVEMRLRLLDALGVLVMPSVTVGVAYVTIERCEWEHHRLLAPGYHVRLPPWSEERRLSK